MKRKIAALLAIFITAGFMSTHKENGIIAEARETQIKTVSMQVGTWKNTVEKKDAMDSGWETFSNKYGTFSSTYAYDDTDFAGTLKATKIRVIPKESSLRTHTVTGRTITVKDSRTTSFPYRASEPSFSSSVSVSATDPILGVVKTGNIGKAKNPDGLTKAPTVAHTSKTNNYVSFGNWPTAGDFYFRFLGNGSSTWQAPGEIPFSFNIVEPPQRFIPYFRFYGDLDVISDTSFRAMHNTPYFDTLTGTMASGIRWADDRQYTGNELVGRTYYTAAGAISGYDLRDINGEKVFKKNSSGNYATVSRDFDMYRAVKNTALRTAPLDTAPLVTEDGFDGMIPTGSYFQVTKGSNGYFYVAFYNTSSIYFEGSKPRVHPGSWGVGGWVKSSDVTEDLPATGVPQGGTLNTHRKGAQFLYEMKQFGSTWTQEYEGTVALDNYNRYFYDEFDVFVEYSGEVEDIRLNNFIASDVSVTQPRTNIFPGTTSTKHDLEVSYKITHEAHKASTEKYTPNIIIRMGNTVIWQGAISVDHNKSVTTKVTIPGVNVPSGNNSVSVEVNPPGTLRKYEERHPDKDPYGDNKDADVHLGYALKTSNIIVSDLAISRSHTEIPPLESFEVTSFDISYTLTHEMDSPVNLPAFRLAFIVDILFDDVVVHSEEVSIGQGETRKTKFTFSNYKIDKKSHKITVEANPIRSRKVVERKENVSNPYLDNVQSVTHSGIYADTSNFVMRKAWVGIEPTTHSQISNSAIVTSGVGDTVGRNVIVHFDIEHELSSNTSTRLLSPEVSIYFNNARVWQGNVGIPQGTTVRRSVEIPIRDLSVLNQVATGERRAEIRVVVNETGAIRESRNGVTPYLTDNARRFEIQIFHPTVCILQNYSQPKRTANTWTETWRKHEVFGVRETEGGMQYCRLVDSKISTQSVSYFETYSITRVLFKSKWTEDMHRTGKYGNTFNALPGSGIGWTVVSQNGNTVDFPVRVKSGYGFELKVETTYMTNRNIPYYLEYQSDPYTNSIGGSGFCRFANVSPGVSPVDHPELLFVTVSGDTGKFCRIMEFIPDAARQANWFNSKKDFEMPLRSTTNGIAERKIYTRVGSKPGIYKVNVATPPPGTLGFRGYDAVGAPYDLSNKPLWLYDNIEFKLEVISQDDLKSHIVQ